MTRPHHHPHEFVFEIEDERGNILRASLVPRRSRIALREWFKAGDGSIRPRSQGCEISVRSAKRLADGLTTLTDMIAALRPN